MRLTPLDGLRGWAAIWVVNYHLFVYFLLKAPVLVDTDAFNFVIKSTAIGILFDGEFAVRVFFVISGCVLSYAFLRGTRDPYHLTDMALRRYPRLAIPVLAATLLGYLIVRLGWTFNHDAALLLQSREWLGRFLHMQPDLGNALRFGVWDVFFRYDRTTTFNPALWTMGFELLGSLLVFGFLGVFNGNRARTLGYLFLLGFLGNTIYGGFLLGVVIAECLARAPGLFERRGLQGIAALFLAVAVGQVVVVGTHAGWRAVTSEIGQNVLAALIVACALVRGPLRTGLCHSVSRQLGRLSFPIYLVHLPILFSFSSVVVLEAWAYGLPGPWVIAITATATAVAIGLIAIGFYHAIELPALRLSRAFSRAVLAG